MSERLETGTKRGSIWTMFTTPTGAEWLTLTLGHKKTAAVIRSGKPGSVQSRGTKAAVPVDDSRTPVRTDV